MKSPSRPAGLCADHTASCLPLLLLLLPHQVYNPPNAKAIVVEKMSEEEFISKTSRLHERRQTLQVKNAYRLRKDSMARLKVRMWMCYIVVFVLLQRHSQMWPASPAGSWYLQSKQPRLRGADVQFRMFQRVPMLQQHS